MELDAHPMTMQQVSLLLAERSRSSGGVFDGALMLCREAK